jgi:hypothetical protein
METNCPYSFILWLTARTGTRVEISIKTRLVTAKIDDSAQFKHFFA